MDVLCEKYKWQYECSISFKLSTRNHEEVNSNVATSAATRSLGVVDLLMDCGKSQLFDGFTNLTFEKILHDICIIVLKVCQRRCSESADVATFCFLSGYPHLSKKIFFNETTIYRNAFELH